MDCADEEAHVGGDLLVAAAAGVEFQGEVADLFGEFEFDVVVDVFGLGVGGYDGFALFGLLLGYGAETLDREEEFFAGEDAGGFDGAGVGYAGFYFVGDEAPVEGEGALPGFELFIEWFAEAAGPHFGGLLLLVVHVLSGCYMFVRLIDRLDFFFKGHAVTAEKLFVASRAFFKITTSMMKAFW